MALRRWEMLGLYEWSRCKTAAIKAKTDNLPSDPASNTQVLATQANLNAHLDILCVEEQREEFDYGHQHVSFLLDSGKQIAFNAIDSSLAFIS